MAYEELINNLAFGAQTRKPGPCLGLYLSPETIYISETHVEKGKLIVDHLVRIPVPPDPTKAAAGGASPATGTLNTDFLADNAKVAALVRQSMSQLRWGTKDVIVTLSHHIGLMRYFAMPAVEKRFWRSSVALEAKKYIPIPFDVLDHDYQVLPMAPDAANKARQGALVAVTQKKTLENVKALLQALGLNLVAMELAPCSVLRLWETLEKPVAGKTHCQVHFDGGNIRILIADKGLPVFFREVFLAQQPSVGDARKIDLGGCLAFAQKQLAVGGLSQVRVSGTVAALAQWGEALGQEAGIKAAVQDTPALLGIKGGDWGGYAAIGSSLRYLVPSALSLDLAAIGRITDEETRTARDLLALSGALAALLVAGGLFNRTLCFMRQGELRHYRKNMDAQVALAHKSNDAIETLLGQMQKQLDAAPKPAVRPKAISLLKDLVDSMPDKVWLERLDLSLPLSKLMGGGDSLTLSGRAAGASVAEEQSLSFQFKDALAKTPVLGKEFPELQMSIQANTAAQAAAGPGMDPDALARKLEDRTQFNITATAGRR